MITPMTHNEIFYSLMKAHIDDDETFSTCKKGGAVVRILDKAEIDITKDIHEEIHNLGTINLQIIDIEKLHKLCAENNIHIIRMYNLNPVIALTKKE